ncbi:MAG: glycosyltransferase family 4 protein [bacterium]
MQKESGAFGNNRKRICLLGMEAWGGLAQIPYALLRALELASLDLDIYFITLRSPETEKMYQASLFTSGRVKVLFTEYETDLGKKIRRLLFYVYNPLYHFRCARLIKKINPDIVHYTTGSVIEVLTAAFFNPDIKAKILTIHDPSPHHEANIPPLKRINNRIYHLIRKTCLKRIPYFHVNARSHIPEASATFNIPQSRIFSTHMVSNVVEDFTDHKTPAGTPPCWPPELDGLKRNTVKILFFGRIRSYKGVEYLIQAADRLLRSGSEVQLILAGEGQIYCDCSSIRDNLVLINRYISNAEVSTIFTASDVVVLPYTGASQTGVISIAYFHSRPVIGTRVGGIPELIEDGKTGFVVRPKDSLALEEKIRSLVEHRETIKEMGKAARGYYDSHYSPEALSRELLHIYLHMGRKKDDHEGEKTYEYK